MLSAKMIICLCNQIRSADFATVVIENKIKNARMLFDYYGTKPDCCCCIKYIQEQLVEIWKQSGINN
jgi:bacterioferritin-associated ferredoxin